MLRMPFAALAALLTDNAVKEPDTVNRGTDNLPMSFQSRLCKHRDKSGERHTKCACYGAMPQFAGNGAVISNRS